MKKIILALCLLLLPCAAYSTTYWVSNDGEATWANCTGATPLNGVVACSVSTMNSGTMAAGDVINFREGTYSYSTLNGLHINLSNKAGEADNPVVFQNYNGEVVLFVGTYGTRMWGLALSNCSYLKFSGLKFYDYTDHKIWNSSHHIEIDSCVFENLTSPYRGGSLYMNEDCGGGASYRCPVSHIWVHHSRIYRLAAGGGCTTVISEGGDALRIGFASNTCSATELGTSSDSMAIEVAEKTFTTQAEIALVAGDWIKLQNDATHNMIGEVTAYSGTSMSVAVKSINGTGTFDSWSIRNCAAGLNSNISITDNYLAYGGHVVMDTYSIKSVFARNVAHNEPWYPADNGACDVTYEASYTNAAYNGLYSHRVWQLTDTFSRTRSLNLVEGNRLGYPGVNPNNDGATGLTIASPGNIIRYNASYGAMHNPMKTKYGTSYGWQANGAQNCVIYNNTLYKGGYGYPYFQTCANPPNATCPKPLVGFRFYAPNVQPKLAFKNNIVVGSYGATENGSEDIQDDSSTDISTINNFCTNADAAKCTQTGDPLFVNPDLSNTSSLTLPDLNLKPDSTAIGTGTYLTTASGAGTNSTSLTVGNAMYFQDGTLGASMAGHQADWIAIGDDLTNIVQIQEVDYATNVITLATNTSWASGAKIRLYKDSNGTRRLYGTEHDMGAYPFQANAKYAPFVK